MSHFIVFVIGPDPDKALAPYHEFECTGTDNEFVQDIDITEKTRKDYETDTCTMAVMPDGSMVSPYSDDFYRDPTPEESEKIGRFAGTGCGNGMSWTSKDWGDGRGYRTKVHFVPEGAVKKQVPISEVMSFRDFVEDWNSIKIVRPCAEPDLKGDHKYGYATVDKDGNVVKVIDRTNPNAKWDYYQEGYDLPLKDGTFSSSARWGDVSRERAEASRIKDADEAFDKWEVAISAHGRPIGWKEFRAREDSGEISFEQARTEYHDQPAIKYMQAFDCPVETYGFDRAAYVEKCRMKALLPFAILKDGVWYERGEMGWWACVSNENKDWPVIAREILDSLSPDTIVTVVDCHI